MGKYAGIAPKQESIDKIKEYFTSKFVAPAGESKLAQDLQTALENPLLTQHVFNDNIVTIIDHSTLRYLYTTPKFYDFFGVHPSDVIDKGFEAVANRILAEDLPEIQVVFNRLEETMKRIEAQDRLHIHLYYSYHVHSPQGILLMYQQTIPLALNDQGYPYLILAIVSDVTNLSKEKGIHYKAVLNKPGHPSRLLISGRTTKATSPLTDREQEIVTHMAEGLSTVEIGDRLSISHDTVRTHRKNILNKTGAKNSVHLLQMSLANGWV